MSQNSQSKRSSARPGGGNHSIPDFGTCASVSDWVERIDDKLRIVPS